MWAINVLIHFQGLPDWWRRSHALCVSLHLFVSFLLCSVFCFFSAPLAYGSAAAYQFTLVTKLWQLSPTLFRVRRVQDSWVPAQRAKPSLWDDNDAIQRMNLKKRWALHIKETSQQCQSTTHILGFKTEIASRRHLRMNTVHKQATKPDSFQARLKLFLLFSVMKPSQNCLAFLSHHTLAN